MSQEDCHDNDQSPDHWCSHFEDECVGELEAEGRIESRLQSAEEHTAQQLWMGFQQTSTAIAQLYNCKDAAHDGYVLLVPFNKAAESLTKFYKDSLMNARECLRLGIQSGRSSKARDIAAWARKKRKSIRREELLAYLSGKSLPPHYRNRQNRSHERQISRFPSHQTETINTGEYSVRDSLSLQGLSGAMSNISMGISRASTPSTCTVNSTFPHSAVMDEFLLHDERNRGEHHRKRASSTSSSASMDVSMESPSRKRGRFL